MPDQVQELGSLERAITDTKAAALSACAIPQAGDTVVDIEHAKMHLAAADVALSMARRTIHLRGREPERGDGLSVQNLSFTTVGQRRRDEL